MLGWEKTLYSRVLFRCVYALVLDSRGQQEQDTGDNCKGNTCSKETDQTIRILNSPLGITAPAPFDIEHARELMARAILLSREAEVGVSGAEDDDEVQGLRQGGVESGGRARDINDCTEGVQPRFLHGM